jgi:hypothetical protein
MRWCERNAVGYLLGSTPRARPGQRLVSPQRRLHQYVLAQALVVVQILVPAAQCVDALG